MSDEELSKALDVLNKASIRLEDAGHAATANKLGESYQVLADELMSDKQHTVSESADKIVVKTKVKRGTGTRDEDKIDVKVKGDNPMEVVEKVNETIQRLNNTADDLRAMQPGENDD